MKANDSVSDWYLGTTGTFTWYICTGTAPTQSEFDLLASSYTGAALVDRYCLLNSATRLKTFGTTGAVTAFNNGMAKVNLTNTTSVFHTEGQATFFILHSPSATWPYVVGSIGQFDVEDSEHDYDLTVLDTSVEESTHWSFNNFYIRTENE